MNSVQRPAILGVGINPEGTVSRLMNQTNEFLNRADVYLQNNSLYKSLKENIPVEKLMGWWEKIVQHKYLVIGLLVAIVIVVGYFIFIFNRVPRWLARMDAYEQEIAPLRLNEEVMNGTYRLADFWVASSYRSYLPCTNYLDYASTASISKILSKGCRFIHLDVFTSHFHPDAEPVVHAGEEKGQWMYTTSITFEEAIREVARVAFNGSLVPNETDPLFLCLEFKTWSQTGVVNKCAGILRKYLEGVFLPVNYAYQGRYTSTHLPMTPIQELFGKVVIISLGTDIKGTAMDELTNLQPNMMGNLRVLQHTSVRDAREPDELIEFNKKNMTIVFPVLPGRKKDNINFYPAMFLGCQFICMNYTEPTEMMHRYVKRFRTGAFRLKPWKLRYHPITVPQPLKQNPKVSFTPKTMTTPYFSITY